MTLAKMQRVASTPNGGAFLDGQLNRFQIPSMLLRSFMEVSFFLFFVKRSSRSSRFKIRLRERLLLWRTFQRPRLNSELQTFNANLKMNRSLSVHRDFQRLIPFITRQDSSLNLRNPTLLRCSGAVRPCQQFVGDSVEDEDQAGQPRGRRRARQDLRCGRGQRCQQLC